MRADWSHLEIFRHTDYMVSRRGQRAGWFQIPLNDTEDLMCCAHDGTPDSGGPEDALDAALCGWEHVSCRVVPVFLIGRREGVSRGRVATWAEMCILKNYFWGPEEPVFQFHPPASCYSNEHPMVLHLWRPTMGSMPLPPPVLVGKLCPADPLPPTPIRP